MKAPPLYGYPSRRVNFLANTRLLDAEHDFPKLLIPNPRALFEPLPMPCYLRYGSLLHGAVDANKRYHKLFKHMRDRNGG